MSYKRSDLNVEQLERLMKGGGKKFVSLEEGAALMSLGKNNFREIAKDAGAVYKVKRRVLINMDKIVTIHSRYKILIFNTPALSGVK